MMCDDFLDNKEENEDIGNFFYCFECIISV